MSDAKITWLDGSPGWVRILGHGQPLLLVHGFPLDHRLWEPLLEHLLPLVKDQYQLIVPDLRGFGNSGMHSDQFSWPIWPTIWQACCSSCGSSNRSRYAACRWAAISPSNSCSDTLLSWPA